MVEKMQFLSLTGPKNDIDRVMDQYLSKYEIQLENALSELQTVADLRPFIAINPYKTRLNRAEELLQLIDTENLTADPSMTVEEAIQIIDEFDIKLNQFREEDSLMESKRSQLQISLDKITPFSGMDFDVSKILHFKTIKFRFGRISKEYIDRFKTYVYDNLKTIFFETYTDDNYVWGLYFVLGSESDQVDAVYKSMHFERIYLPDDYSGTPLSCIYDLKSQIDELTAKITESNEKKTAIAQKAASELYSAYKKLQAQNQNFDIRKLAACTQNEHTFYILCGWMTSRDARLLEKDLEKDDNLFCIMEDDQHTVISKTPTKLNNPKFLKPFEMFVRMYGLPAYNEFDPTIFIALTYTFIFGWMFGDVGQGLCLFIGGFALYFWKKINLAGIIGYAGIFSTFFGFMFGSIFGFEDIIPARWIRPINSMSTLPFIGSINTVFVVAIAFGMALILITMIIHIINGLRAKDIEATYLDTNGIAGLVFYGSVVTTIVLYMTEHALPATIVLVIMFVIPLIIIAFKEHIAKILLKKKEKSTDGKIMICVQAFFELFDVLLTYFSNTLSFIRIGAFAVSHAAMMEVVMMLAGGEASANIIVVILGNVFVCAMEGLIVGIQVLRLEYYELFSRFYKGSGKEFKPYLKE